LFVSLPPLPPLPSQHPHLFKTTCLTMITSLITHQCFFLNILSRFFHAQLFLALSLLAVIWLSFPSVTF
jgi:hypothetical protein